MSRTGNPLPKSASYRCRWHLLGAPIGLLLLLWVLLGDNIFGPG